MHDVDKEEIKGITHAHSFHGMKTKTAIIFFAQERHVLETLRSVGFFGKSSFNSRLVLV